MNYAGAKLMEGSHYSCELDHDMVKMHIAILEQSLKTHKNFKKKELKSYIKKMICLT